MSASWLTLDHEFTNTSLHHFQVFSLTACSNILFVTLIGVRAMREIFPLDHVFLSQPEFEFHVLISTPAP